MPGKGAPDINVYLMIHFTVGCVINNCIYTITNTSRYAFDVWDQTNISYQVVYFSFIITTYNIGCVTVGKKMLIR